MIVLNVNYANYKILLAELAASLNVPYKGEDSLFVDTKQVKGNFRTLSLFDELQVLLSNATFQDEIMITRERSDKRYFILHFDDVFITDTVRFRVDNESLQKSNTHHAVARLTSNIFRTVEEIPAGIKIRSVKVLFNEQWLKKYLNLSEEDDVLQKYISLKTESFDIEKLDSEYLKLMDELWDENREGNLQQIYAQNRVTLLVERFFSSLYNKMSFQNRKFSLTRDDINRLVKVEQILTSDFSQSPPTIEKFSRIATMSSTKLKKGFKELYGNSIYAYYQQLRMEKARTMLMSGQYNVRAVAEAVGYLNMSNFTLAFKKQFHISPGMLNTGEG